MEYCYSDSPRESQQFLQHMGAHFFFRKLNYSHPNSIKKVTPFETLQVIKQYIQRELLFYFILHHDNVRLHFCELKRKKFTFFKLCV